MEPISPTCHLQSLPKHIPILSRINPILHIDIYFLCEVWLLKRVTKETLGSINELFKVSLSVQITKKISNPTIGTKFKRRINFRQNSIKAIEMVWAHY